ncbi:PREDICTED: Fanconi anemia group I protein-like isoform X2 [Priapulus caudatus]|uniref:Fanconi anemia group I protein-like isoform X2 n=1 Tax=Priapulus caudatus TaxID=37621 RepID=A0ABM1E5W1_PRICU|nr:PREDICTED: Fanconi anemia group I protein-like isoform X2 [Priapulus caudatus]
MEKIDKTVLRLHEEKNYDELEKFLSSLSLDDISLLIDRRVLRGNGDPAALIRALFLASPSKFGEGIARRIHVYKHVVGLLRQDAMSTSLASEVIGTLLLETDGFSANSLAELAEMFLEIIRNIGNIVSSEKCQWLELFPKLLSSISRQDKVLYNNNDMPGAEYKSHVLNRLCSARWDAELVIQLTTMFRDIDMSSEELRFVIEKLVRMFGDLELQKLPAVVYQLLLLSTKGHKRCTLEGIINFFNEQDKKVSSQHRSEAIEVEEEGNTVEQLRQVEGTVSLYIIFTIKQDQELGREYIKYLKANQQSPSRILSPFNVALALSVGQIHRFEDQLFDFLKGCIIKSYKDCERCSDSEWLQGLVSQDCDVTPGIVQAITNSSYGWDHVTHGLVHVGFLLMDTYGPKAAFGKTTISPAYFITPGGRACKLGAVVLLETFKLHKIVREDILEQILNRLVTKATSPAHHYLDLLAAIVRCGPQQLLEWSQKVREVFDYLSLLPATTSCRFLTAVQPLMKLSMPLKDALMIVLRKGMFSSHLEARKMAVNGYLQVLKNFKVLGTIPGSQQSQSSSSGSWFSQIQADVHSRPNPKANEALCLEIIASLRKCFKQQAEIRTLLYEGIPVVVSSNAELCGPALELLLTHLRAYYVSGDDVLPPVSLELCVATQGDVVTCNEPLGHLLASIVQILEKVAEKTSSGGEDDEGEQTDLEALQLDCEAVLKSLSSRMVNAELEDFELDKSADFSTNNTVGLKNHIFASLVLGIYEVSMEFTFVRGKYSRESCEMVLQLYECYSRLAEVLREKGTAGRKGGDAEKKGRPAAAVKPLATPTSLLTLRCVATMLNGLFCDVNPARAAGLAVLRGNADFVRHLVSVSLQKGQHLSTTLQVNTKPSKEDNTFQSCCKIAKSLLTHYTDSGGTASQRPRQPESERQRRAVLLMCVEGCSAMITLITTFYKDRVTEFLNHIAGDSSAGDVSKDVHVYAQIKRFQRLMAAVLATDEDSNRMKEVVYIVNVISQLATELEATEQHYVQLHKWVQQVCQERQLEDLAVLKPLLALLFRMTGRLTSGVVLALELAQDIHVQLKDIDQAIDVRDGSHFAFVTPRTAATVLAALLLRVDRMLEDAEWVVTVARGNVAPSAGARDADVDAAGATQREGREKHVSLQLGNLVNCLCELVQAAVPGSAGQDALIRTVARMYAALTNFTKYYIMLYKQHAGHLCPRYEKLVRLSGTNLTKNVYPMINYIQTVRLESIQQKAAKPEKAGKKKGGVGEAGGAAKSVVLKESHTIPNLIYAIEQYERYLIQLSKKSKVNLMEHMKASTARDFRIDASAVQAALEDQSDDDDENDDDNDDDANNVNVAVEQQDVMEGEEQVQEPPAKRPCPEKSQPEPPSKKASKLSKRKK